MPMTWRLRALFGTGLPRRSRKIVSLVTVLTSMGLVKGMDSRGCTLKPSRVFTTARSSQSEGRSVQEGNGRLMRRPVLLLGSATVNRSLGNGPSAGVSTLKRTSVWAAHASEGHRWTAPRKTRTVWKKRRTSPGWSFVREYLRMDEVTRALSAVRVGMVVSSLLALALPRHSPYRQSEERKS